MTDCGARAVYKKIVPHMRISERHFELPDIEKCRENFREFLCRRNFPGCCHVGLCNKYGAPEPVLTTADFSQLQLNDRFIDRPTTVTFVNGSQDMRVHHICPRLCTASSARLIRMQTHVASPFPAPPALASNPDVTHLASSCPLSLFYILGALILNMCARPAAF